MLTAEHGLVAGYVQGRVNGGQFQKDALPSVALFENTRSAGGLVGYCERRGMCVSPKLIEGRFYSSAMLYEA